MFLEKSVKIALGFWIVARSHRTIEGTCKLFKIAEFAQHSGRSWAVFIRFY